MACPFFVTVHLVIAVVFQSVDYTAETRYATDVSSFFLLSHGDPCCLVQIDGDLV